MALPIIVGTAIGRIGCFLTGNEDHTVGLPTQLPWGVNFGDGPRHPTQLYEILFLIVLGMFIVWLSRRPHREGDLFKCYFVAYLAFRFAVDFLKPEVRVFAGLSSIQLASLIALLYVIVDRHWESRRAIPISSKMAGGNMTTANGSTHPLNERKPFVSGWLKQVPVKPLAIILVAAAVLIVSSCARLGGTFQNHDTPSTLATVGLFAGVAAIPPGNRFGQL